MGSYKNEEQSIYPYCYKIKESCPPCNKVEYKDNAENCLKELSNFLLISENQPKQGTRKGKYIEEEKAAFERVKNCLQKYGDIYDKLGILPYINPTTKAILFPDQTRIQSKFNEFIRKLSRSDNNEMDEYKIKLFNILLNSKLREIYNDLYEEPYFANRKSLEPKDPGIGALIDKGENDEEFSSIGGKLKRKKNTKRRKRSKRKKRTKRKIK